MVAGWNGKTQRRSGVAAGSAAFADAHGRAGVAAGPEPVRRRNPAMAEGGDGRPTRHPLPQVIASGPILVWPVADRPLGDRCRGGALQHCSSLVVRRHCCCGRRFAVAESSERASATPARLRPSPSLPRLPRLRRRCPQQERPRPQFRVPFRRVGYVAGAPTRTSVHHKDRRQCSSRPRTAESQVSNAVYVVASADPSALRPVRSQPQADPPPVAQQPPRVEAICFPPRGALSVVRALIASTG